MSKGDKLRQIRCRLLSLFVAQVRMRHFDLYDRKGMVSRRKTSFLAVRIIAFSWLART
jgi:hypothetical protein